MKLPKHLLDLPEILLTTQDGVVRLRITEEVPLSSSVEVLTIWNILHALRKTDGNARKSAEKLALSKSNFYRLIRKYEIALKWWEE